MSGDESNSHRLQALAQACSHWLDWSGFNLTTFTQLYNNDLVNSVTLKQT